METHTPSQALERLHRQVETLRRQRATHKGRSRFVRVAYAVAGVTVLAGGILLLFLPGPAVLVIPVGLAILSLEFVWAERLLDSALDQAAKADRKFNTPEEQRLIYTAMGLGLAALIAWVILGDVPILPG
jgi:tellurite resistance protein TerC